MQVFRFDPAIAMPAGGFGATAGPLIGDGSSVRVEVVYVPAGGVIERVAPGRGSADLVAVVAGRGWVTGADGRRRDMGVGYGAWWAAGEEGEAGSDEGMTAVRVAGQFDVWAMGVTREIVVVDYDPEWPAWFERVRATVWPAVGDVALRIDHVGSTAVPGLAAKPIIDLDVVVGSAADVPGVVERLAAIGYRWRGDLGVPGRESFKLVGRLGRAGWAGAGDGAGDGAGLPEHHLYLVVENSRPHQDHWRFRDALREDGALREEYAALKRRNAALAGDDMDIYVAAKAAFVTGVLSR